MDFFVLFCLADIDFLSVDIDFNDYWILLSILKRHKYKAKIIAIEYNSHVPVNESRVIQYNRTQNWDGITQEFGVGLAALEKLAIKFGYRVVFCESHGVNAFLVHQKFMTEEKISLQEVYRPPNYFGKGGNYPKGLGKWVWV
jgi:hypothetical protein